MSEPPLSASGDNHRVKVWDGLVRLTHWGFALLIPAMWWTAENSEWGWHKRLGLILIGLVAARILWGFVGPRTARFSQFLRGPGTVIAHFRGKLPARAKDIGHNPAGGWSTIALLGAMLVQASLGLFAGDPFDGMTGPLNPLVGVMTADAITEIHETFFYVVLALVALHLGAIAWYAVIKQDDLVRPMVTGRRIVSRRIQGIGDLPFGRAALVIALAAGLAGWIAVGAPPLS
jgi:cytochrome b